MAERTFADALWRPHPLSSHYSVCPRTFFTSTATYLVTPGPSVLRACTVLCTLAIIRGIPPDSRKFCAFLSTSSNSFP